MAAGAASSLISGATSAAAGGLFGSLGLIGLNKRNKRLIQQQEESQMRLNEQNAQLNYDYGEMSADAAHQRSLGLLAAQTEANSYESQVADLNKAGLNVGLLYGGAGGGGGAGGAGGGAQGQGAGNQKGQAPNYLEIEAIKNERRAVNAQLAQVAADTSKAHAERKQIEAETKKIDEERKTSEELTPVQLEVLRQEGIQKFIENAKEHVKLAGDTEKGGNISAEEYNDILQWGLTINNNSQFHNEIINATAKLAGEVEGVNIQNELNTQEKEIAWRNLLLAEAEGKISKIKAAAIKMAALWVKGILSNPSTWREAIEKASDGFLQVLEEAGQ